jgi:peptide/nickel transport system permease protein
MSASESGFNIVGMGYKPHEVKVKHVSRWRSFLKLPLLSIAVLSVIVLGCVMAGCLANHDPSKFYLLSLSQPPDGEFFFGTDSLGRDIFSIIWYGGRASIIIGLLSACVATVIGVVYGCIAGMASEFVCGLMMRAVELMHSIPVLLTLLLAASIMGKQNVLSLSVLIGAVSWYGLARIVRVEARQIRGSEYVLAAKCMGAGFLHLMRRHLIPNFVSAIMFVVVSSVSQSMSMESTLSFLGFGLPAEILSWGNMLALADRALLLNTWWVIVIPGLFLISTLLCITTIAYHFRSETNKRPSNL